MAQAGEPFPNVSKPSTEGGEIRISDYQDGKKLVVFFFPRSMTPGCVRETIEFGQKRSLFEQAGAKIMGASTDSTNAQQKHAVHCAAGFPILSDKDKTLIAALGIDSGKGSAKRTTYVIDAKGVIRRVFEGVKVDGHVDAVLEAVKAI